MSLSSLAAAMALLMPTPGRAGVPAPSCKQGAACANDHQSFDDATSLLHSASSTAAEVEALWGLTVDPVVTLDEQETALGFPLETPKEAVDALLAGAPAVHHSSLAHGDLRLRDDNRRESTPEACTEAQKEEDDCCNPLETNPSLHWNTQAWGGGEWSYSNNYLRYDFKDDVQCNGTANYSQNGTAWVIFTEPRDTEVVVYVEGVAESMWEYVSLWTIHLNPRNQWIYEWKFAVQANETFRGEKCEHTSCEMCKVKAVPQPITVPAGKGGLYVAVNSKDHKWHMGAYFQVYLGSPSRECNSCTCRGECANNDAAAKFAGEIINHTNLTCSVGPYHGYCGNHLEPMFIRMFRAACPKSCSFCHPDDCHQNDHVACDAGDRLKALGKVDANVTIHHCGHVAQHNATYNLCDYAMMRVACPQTCLWRGCRPTLAPTPMPTGVAQDKSTTTMWQPPEITLPSTTRDLQDLSASPTSSPTPSPSPAAASAQGDPHITNLLGKSFDLRQPGKYTLVQLPKEGPSFLNVEGLVQSIGNACTMFITECNLMGLLFGGDSVRVRASRENMYQSQHEQPTPFSLQTAPGEPWMALSSFPIGEEVLVKNYSFHGVVVEIKANRDVVAATDGRDSGSDAATQGFFLINIITPRQPLHTQIKLSKRRAWFNVQVARLRNMGYAQVGGVLGTTEPDEKWSEPTNACERHMAGADAHPRMSLLRVEGDMHKDVSIAAAAF